MDRNAVVNELVAMAKMLVAEELVEVSRDISADAVRMSQQFGPKYILCRGDGTIRSSDIHDGREIAKDWSWKRASTAARFLKRLISEDRKAFLCFKGKAYSVVPD